MSRVLNDRPLRQREPRVRDPGFLRWLHQGLPCVSCALAGKTAVTPIEAAHVKIGIASKGWTECGRGVRPSDWRCIPLCATEHRLARDAFDVNQRAFLDRIGLGDRVADLCEELYRAYKSGGDGAAVIRRFAR